MLPHKFDPSDYGEFFEQLIDEQKLNTLGHGTPNRQVHSALETIDREYAFSLKQIVNQDYASACISALWLHHDFLDQSHTISQSISSNTGSYWHGIMHRREGDYWNSKYWFKQVGSHPVYPILREAIKTISQTDNKIDKKLKDSSKWDPFGFIDRVEEFIGQNNESEVYLRKIQQLEWQILFDYSYNKALGE